MSKRFISIDVATKSLAVSVVDYNMESLDLRDKNSFKNLSIVKTYTVNLAPGQLNATIEEVDRILKITNFFNENLVEYFSDNTTILLERQIATTPSYICYIALITLALDKNINVKTIAATRKNQLTIDDEKIGKYLRNCHNSYTANKLHSKGLVKLIQPYLSNTDAIDINPKMVIDWSDTISQLIAYLLLPSTII